MIFRACRLAAALGVMRRLGRVRRRRAPLTSPSPNAERSAVREEHAAAVPAGRALPPGSALTWWALDQGLRAARGDLVLFLDANNLPRPVDTRPAPSTAPAAHRENP